MVTALLASFLLANLPIDVNAGESALTTMRIAVAGDGLLLGWSDTEDMLRGTIEPARPTAGAPLTLSLRLDPRGGAPYDGPLTVSLRPLETVGDQKSITVPPSRDGAWRATFTPVDEGEHRLEVSWRGSHFKAVRGTLTVAGARLPWWVPPAMGAGLILVALGGGAWFLLRRQEKRS